MAEETERRVQRLMATTESTAPNILVTEKLGDAGVAILESGGNVDVSFGLTPEELRSKISLCDALVVRSSTRVTRDIFEASKGRLRVVGRAGVGVDNIDLQAASEHGVVVVNAPTANTVAAAEHAVALLCALARKVPQADASMRRGEWARSAYVGVSLNEKTAAIMGFGRVGYEVARRLKGLGMRVVVYDPYCSQERVASLGVEQVEFEEALARADFVSLHMPLTQTTERLFGDEAFARMKPGARIVNVSRGGVLDERALARALDSGAVAGAALDVFVEEPPPPDHPLVGREDVIVTPRLGGSTAEAQEGVAAEIAEAVLRTLRGQQCATAVNTPTMRPEDMRELAPYTVLAYSLGKMLTRIAVGGITDVSIEYRASKASDALETRMLRAMVIKGMVEPVSNRVINLVNADLTAEQRGMRVSETVVPSGGGDNGPVSSIRVRASGMSAAAFGSALDGQDSTAIALEGKVADGAPQLTRMGDFPVSIRLEGSVLFCRQRDQPGMIGAVGSLLGAESVNVNHMAVGRIKSGSVVGEAVMAIGVDSLPSREVLAAISSMEAIAESLFVEFG
uniref:D-3-phosphoglycerate dehydrogenase n=1 Tax=Prasinoderma coloniale TaxID=156133 RepID=A0A7R9XXT6_9VIRI|eukprot:PRCOL_00002795-RA